MALALESDFAQAAAVANKPQDEALKRKLWLSIARHIIQQKPAGSGKQNGADQTVRYMRPNSENHSSCCAPAVCVPLAILIRTSCGNRLARSTCQLQVLHCEKHYCRLCVISIDGALLPRRCTCSAAEPLQALHAICQTLKGDVAAT